jgi:hypothetical protein
MRSCSSADEVDAAQRDVQGRPDWFTLAYFHTPDARRTEITQAGFAATRIVAIEGLGATADLDDDLEDTPHGHRDQGLTGHSRCAPRRRPPADGELSGLPSVWFLWRMHSQTVNRSR